MSCKFLYVFEVDIAVSTVNMRCRVSEMLLDSVQVVEGLITFGTEEVTVDVVYNEFILILTELLALLTVEMAL